MSILNLPVVNIFYITEHAFAQSEAFVVSAGETKDRW